MDSFDRLILGVMAGLAVATGVVLAAGDHVGVRPTNLLPTPGSAPPVTTSIQVTFPEAMDTATVEERLSTDPATTGSMTWSGRTLVYTPELALTPGQAITVNLEPGATTQTGRRMERRTSWSFTPRQPGIMYLAPADAQVRSLWYRSPDGGDPREVYAPEHGIVDFEPSHDGSQIALTVNNDDSSTDVWIIDSRGGNPRQLTDCSPGLCAAPTWSPDGLLLAFERRDPALNGQLGPARVWLYELASNKTSPVFEPRCSDLRRRGAPMEAGWHSSTQISRPFG